MSSFPCDKVNEASETEETLRSYDVLREDLLGWLSLRNVPVALGCTVMLDIVASMIATPEVNEESLKECEKHLRAFYIKRCEQRKGSPP